jgi:acyl-CoA thioesterase
MPHVLDEATHLSPDGEHCYRGATHPAYANMVGPFGGVTAATLLKAVLQHPQHEGEPIALTVNFAGPLAEGGFEIEARPLRTNRSTQHWTMQLRQDGVACASGSAVLARRRQTWSAPEAAAPEGLPAAAALQRHPLPGAPTWVRAYDMRFPDGVGPFDFDGQEQPHSRSQVWVRDEPPRALDFVALAALADSFFPRIFVRRRRPTPIGTVTLTTYFHGDAALLAAQGERHLLGTARAQSFRNGYFDQSAEVWSDTGVLLASTHQMVYYRE